MSEDDLRLVDAAMRRYCAGSDALVAWARIRTELRMRRRDRETEDTREMPLPGDD